MLQRALLVSLLFAVAVGCGHAGAKLMTDTPILEYKAPDADEIAGIETDDDEKEEKEEKKAPPPKAEIPAPAPAPTAAATPKKAEPAKGTPPAPAPAPPKK
jgi:hypothetical protein